MQISSVEINEGYLYSTLKSIFPDCTIHHNVKKNLKIKYPLGSFMEFDVWIPKYRLCFEFQDAHHYVTTWYYQNTKGHVKQKDDIKTALSRRNDITLLAIPCWWMGDIGSLVATIKYDRPDLRLSSKVPPIPLNPPLGFFPVATIPGVGELMLASFPYPNLDVDLRRHIWWMGEKYDGVRCCWNPDDKNSYSRYGKDISLFPSMLGLLPQIFIDCEVWFGRGQFSFSYMLVSGGSHSHWCFLRMISFDVPSYDVQRKPYDDRYKLLLENIVPSHPFNIVSFRVISSSFNLNWYAQQIIDAGGEGIMLQKRGSIYKQGRSLDIVKLKIALADAEGIVVGILPDSSVKLKLPNGTQFTVPPEDIHTPTQLSLGTIVSFSFENNARRETPANPKIYRIRQDLLWDDVVRNYERDRKFLNKTSSIKGYTTKPKGYWTPKNMRSYMEEFAKRRNMDPLKIDNWYKLFTDFYQSKSGRMILGKFNNTYFRALQHLFPEISFEPRAHKPSYDKVENRRRFFETYARKNKFDAQDPEAWYRQPYAKIIASKGAHQVIAYHSYNVTKALIDLFPNIGLERIKFQFRQNIWESKENRKSFFVNYAEKNGFDPLLAENWYKQSPDKIATTKGATRVLFYHGNSLATALGDLFPDIGFDRSKFKKSVGIFHTTENRKNFFISYARKNGFDPYVADNWYIQPREKIMESKGARIVLHYYKSSVSAALIHLFPDIGLEKAKFQVSSSVWADAENRRQFFVEHAKEQNFDFRNVLNWVAHPARKLMGKGGRNVIMYHGDSFGKALLELFPNLSLDLEEYYEKSWYDSPENRKRFFERIAKENDFDPLQAENWYKISLQQLKSRKDMYAILYYYSNSIPKALGKLFPGVKFNSSKFQGD